MRIENFYISAKFLRIPKFSMSYISRDILKKANQIKNLFERFSQMLSRKPEKQPLFVHHSKITFFVLISKLFPK